MANDKISLLRKELLSKLDAVQYRIERMQRHYSQKEVDTWFDHRDDLILKLKVLPSDEDRKESRRRLLDFRIDVESIELYREQMVERWKEEQKSLPAPEPVDDVSSPEPDECPFKSGDRVYYVNSRSEKIPGVIAWISHPKKSGPCARVRFDSGTFRSAVRIKNLIPNEDTEEQNNHC